MHKKNLCLPGDLLMLPMLSKYADQYSNCSRNFSIEIEVETGDNPAHVQLAELLSNIQAISL